MAETPKVTETKSRDRARTRDMILAAAKHVLASDGFQGFGVNAIARQAGCDKQLIYRYFGGLDGLAEAIGEDLAGWIGETAVPAAKPRTYGQWAAQMLDAYLTALIGSPLVQKISAWELAEPSPVARKLAAARSAAMVRWLAAQRGDIALPATIDAFAVNAIFVAAAQHLVLASSASGGFSGISLAQDSDWIRVRATLAAMIARVYPDEEPRP
ncbi:MAG: TetR/AcrR family transcriptional regulator [Rhizobiaceae bacterium]